MNSNFFSPIHTEPLESENSLTLAVETALEVHLDWLPEVRRRMKMNYGDYDTFAIQNKLDPLSVFWFTHGNPVNENIFKAVASILDLDWEQIQQAGN